MPVASKSHRCHMSLETGDQIDGRVVAVLPPTDVIQRVETLGKDQKQPYRVSRMLKYEWQPGIPMDQDDLLPDDQPPDQIPTIIPPTIDQVANQIDPLHNNSYAILADTDDDDDTPDDENNVDVNQGAMTIPPSESSEDDSTTTATDTPHEQNINAEGASTEQDQGAPTFQGAIINSEHDNVKDDKGDEHIGDIQHESSNESESFEDDETIVLTEEERETKERQLEHERRSNHLITHSSEEYGRGKRTPKPRQWSFLQTKFSRLTATQRHDYLANALNEYRLSNTTNLLMPYVT
eukprot:CAMPEP_0176485814 /NCGR_PEP_ID=MMETSP0200_2-20121128/5240_1 /TAXON_ID=947934 /ORGANISM="Chaetoceros sp., Strain GSL56" /LENGTH=293 /DNA_ID=CAMNT_0017882483 /DNA_START=399 /DNA_END=1276 /DNA_ORIENTATION=+